MTWGPQDLGPVVRAVRWDPKELGGGRPGTSSSPPTQEETVGTEKLHHLQQPEPEDRCAPVVFACVWRRLAWRRQWVQNGPGVGVAAAPLAKRDGTCTASQRPLSHVQPSPGDCGRAGTRGRSPSSPSTCRVLLSPNGTGKRRPVPLPHLPKPPGGVPRWHLGAGYLQPPHWAPCPLLESSQPRCRCPKGCAPGRGVDTVRRGPRELRCQETVSLDSESLRRQQRGGGKVPPTPSQSGRWLVPGSRRPGLAPSQDRSLEAA